MYKEAVIRANDAESALRMLSNASDALADASLVRRDISSTGSVSSAPTSFADLADHVLTIARNDCLHIADGSNCGSVASSASGDTCGSRILNREGAVHELLREVTTFLFWFYFIFSAKPAMIIFWTK